MLTAAEQRLIDRLRARLADVGLLAVVETAALEHHVTVEDVLLAGRTRNVAAARRDSIVALYVYNNRSQPEIATLLGLDRTTVMHHLHAANIRSKR